MKTSRNERRVFDGSNLTSNKNYSFRNEPKFIVRWLQLRWCGSVIWFTGHEHSEHWFIVWQPSWSGRYYGR